ncbi:MAG: hypothetical protein OSB19_11115 [Opitutaceae bacterium]|nr:hypothetical protein [Opitutaceae bacterium]
MALDKDSLASLAARMLSDYDNATPGTAFAEGLRLELPDAWRLQSAVTRLREARGEKVIGFKVGCVCPGNQKRMGVQHPVWGRLWELERHQDGATLTKANYANISIEAEFGIILARPVTGDMSLDEVESCVHAVYPLLELHNLAMRGEPPHGHELVANNCINCGVVLGAPVTDFSHSRATDLKLVYDGTVVEQWEALAWPGDILAAVNWLAGNLSEHGIALQSGDLLLTGAWGPPIPVENHTRVEVTSSAFGNVSATFT